MPEPDKPAGTRHLVVVRTEGIRDGGGAPSDAVVLFDYWHPGDRERIRDCAESVEWIIERLVEDGWRLVQRVDFDRPYESELIFDTQYGSFFGPNSEEIADRVGLRPEDFERTEE